MGYCTRGMPSESEFIYLGMVKEKWTGLSPERIQSMLDNPASMDDNIGWEDFIECFYRYYDWYWDNQRSN